VRKTLSLHPSGDGIIKLSVLLAATVLAFLIGTAVGTDERQVNEPVAVSAPTESEAGVLSLPELGLTVHFPSEWTGEDTIIAGKDVVYSKGRDWTIYAYTRQEGVQSFLGEGPSLLVRVVAADSDVGRSAIADYFEVLNNLKPGVPTATYDVVANKTTEMTLVGSASGNLIVVKSWATDESAPFASQAYYKVSRGQLYVIAYARSSPVELDVDQPLIREILTSLSITD